MILGSPGSYRTALQEKRAVVGIAGQQKQNQGAKLGDKLAEHETKAA